MFRKIGVSILVFCLGLFMAGTLYATTVAVFPIEDLSHGVNGVDFNFTRLLSKELKSMGLEVVPEKEMMNFMVRHRIRRVGSLSTYYVLRMREQLGADLVLLGSICQKEEKAPGALGLTLYLLRTDDARVVWSGVEGLSRADMLRLLGIDQPHSTAELLPIVAQDIFASWPDQMEQVLGRIPFFPIQSVSLRPLYVKPGHKLECRLKLRPIGRKAPDLYLNIKGIGTVPMYNDGHWGYTADWFAPVKDGKYPVEAVFHWSSGRTEKTYLGLYCVDSVPPAVTLRLSGVRLGDSVAFRDRIFAVPKLIHPEPISRWEISIEDEKGKSLISEHGTGNLPSRFVWKGQTGGGSSVNQGVYRMVLRVWDKADNMAKSIQKVAVRRTPPSMILQVKRQGSNMFVDLGNKGEVPISFWCVEVRSEDGRVVKTSEGEKLPARIGVNVAEAKNKKLECVVMLKDILGNSARREIKDLVRMANKSSTGGNRGKKQETWESEF